MPVITDSDFLFPHIVGISVRSRWSKEAFLLVLITLVFYAFLSKYKAKAPFWKDFVHFYLYVFLKSWHPDYIITLDKYIMCCQYE